MLCPVACLLLLLLLALGCAFGFLPAPSTEHKHIPRPAPASRSPPDSCSSTCLSFSAAAGLQLRGTRICGSRDETCPNLGQTGRRGHSSFLPPPFPATANLGPAWPAYIRRQPRRHQPQDHTTTRPHDHEHDRANITASVSDKRPGSHLFYLNLCCSDWSGRAT